MTSNTSKNDDFNKLPGTKLKKKCIQYTNDTILAHAHRPDKKQKHVPN